MKKVHCVFQIPDDMDIDSVVIKLEHKPKARERRRMPNKQDQTFRVPFETEEPEEGILFDELY